MERTVLSYPTKFWGINTDIDAAWRRRYGTKMSSCNHMVVVAEP
jgi:hypothetical protein